MKELNTWKDIPAMLDGEDVKIYKLTAKRWMNPSHFPNITAYSDFTKWCRDNPHLNLDSRLHAHGGAIGDGGYISDEKTRIAFSAWRAAIKADRHQRGELVAWRPIDTAPKDNKRALYLARFHEGELVELDFNGGWEYWQEGHEMSHINGYVWVSNNGIEEPTHWAYQDEPLPSTSSRPAEQVLLEKAQACKDSLTDEPTDSEMWDWLIKENCSVFKLPTRPFIYEYKVFDSHGDVISVGETAREAIMKAMRGTGERLSKGN